VSDMTVQVTAQQLDGIASKLDVLDESLSADEKAILLAVFAVAAEELARREEAASEVEGFGAGRQSRFVATRKGTAVRLNQGFQDSFQLGSLRNPAAERSVGIDVDIGGVGR